jgi:hypothetical protein
MKKSVLVLFALMSIVEITCGQKKNNDVIYLKNGVVIHGQIIRSLLTGQVIFKKRDNNILVFEPAQFDSIRKTSKVVKKIHPGYFNLTEAGILTGNSANSNKSPFSLINISGWQFKNQFSAGVGAGIEFLKETYLPVVADFRYSLNRQGANPFFGIQGGYSFALDKPNGIYSNLLIHTSPEFNSGSNLEMNAKGGLLLNPCIGICTPLGGNMALTFSAGYRMMRNRYSRSDGYKIDIDYNRLSLKIGLLIQ